MKRIILAGAAFAVVASGAVAWGQDFQVGARAKGMGGSYTAFDDDPVSVWINPAGTATQPLQVAIDYQTFTSYESEDRFTNNKNGRGQPHMNWTDPAILPSFLGVVVPIGNANNPLTIGFAYIRPMQLTMTYGVFVAGFPGQGNEIEDQQFSRFRLSVGYDFRFGKESSFLTHVALGVGLDMGISRWFETFNSIPGVGGNFAENVTRATSIGFGAGLGLLVGIYDNGEDLKVNFGAAYQSRIDFNWEIDRNAYPVYNWPGMTNAGITVYMLKGMPLRVTVDGQWIDWKHAAHESGFVGFRSVRSVSNFSTGMEYRLNVKEDGSLSVSPRLGYRHIENFWRTSDSATMPAVGQNQLAINSKASAFHVICLGAGLTWTTADGKARSLDLGIELNGDSPNFGFGYTHEF